MAAPFNSSSLVRLPRPKPHLSAALMVIMLNMLLTQHQQIVCFHRFQLHVCYITTWPWGGCDTGFHTQVHTALYYLQVWGHPPYDTLPDAYRQPQSDHGANIDYISSMV